MGRMTISIPDKIKLHWIELSKKNHTSVSQMLRNAMIDFEKKFTVEIKSNTDEIEDRIKRILDEKFEKLGKIQLDESKRKNESSNDLEILNIKNSIVNLLKRVESQTLRDFTEVLSKTDEEIYIGLKELQNDKIVKMVRDGWILV